MFTDLIDIGWFQISVALAGLIAGLMPLFSVVGTAPWPYKTRPFLCGLPVGCAGVGVFYALFSGSWPVLALLALALPVSFIWGVVIYFLRMGIMLGTKEGQHWDIAWHINDWYPIKSVQFAAGAINSYAALGVLVYMANEAVIRTSMGL
jgi:hypothetical protein